MKKTLAILALTFSLGAIAQDAVAPANPAQPQKPAKPKAEMMASRHSKHLEKMLGLSADQTQKTYDAMLARFNEIHAIRTKYGKDGDKEARHKEVKAVRQKYVQTMSGILTPEQKTKWEAHRMEVKKSREMRKNQKGTPPPAAGNGDIKKLTDDEDGIIDEQ